MQLPPLFLAQPCGTLSAFPTLSALQVHAFLRSAILGGHCHMRSSLHPSCYHVTGVSPTP